MNAREGIKTNSKNFFTVGNNFTLKTMNAREGIKTELEELRVPIIAEG